MKAKKFFLIYAIFSAVILSVSFLIWPFKSNGIRQIESIYAMGASPRVYLEDDETLKIDVREEAKQLGFDFIKYYKIQVSDNATVKNQTISVNGNGNASVTLLFCDLYSWYSYRWGIIHTIKTKELTEIRTAEDLNNIRNNLSGKYILKNDIDLSDYENWEPIGESFGNKSFKGWFVNRGYVIRNLKIINSQKSSVGLFGYCQDVYFDGISLEGVDIKNASDTNRDSGGLAGYVLSGEIKNCSVKGNIISQKTAGGLLGFCDRTNVIDCSFEGMVEVIHSQYEDQYYGGGGLIGAANMYYFYPLKIENCVVKASVSHPTRAGGICGYLIYFSDSLLRNCAFSGTVNGEDSDQLVGYTRTE